ncbi:MAG: 50S ribosomal protein L4 [Planctomycetota bacterium]|nr:50S ribosomal protein L4 [Planctomycetota bacterium]
MARISKLNSNLTATGEVEIDEAQLAAKITKQLIHDACVMYHANRRVGTVRTKSRAEIAGTRAKMYRQKGTGRARAGHKQSPIRRGGGHAFAKRPKDWSYTLPRKALRVATRMALRLKLKAGQLFVVDSLDLPEARTKHVATALRSGGYLGQSCLFVTEGINTDLVRAARNIPKVSVLPRVDLNADIVMRHRNVLVFSDAVAALSSLDA